ncbi:hypothetical protein AMECASPLE_018279 [Ameca splendens]|uniref:Uncharacterized protein n=1 Tax=Ameca splendens TaxID=208324 RepID=A0ABV0XFQ4_9TELE
MDKVTTVKVVGSGEGAAASSTGDFSLNSGGSGGRVATGGSKDASSSVLITSSSSHCSRSGTSEDSGSISVTKVEASSALSSGGGFVASVAAAASGKGEGSKVVGGGGGSSSMSYSFGSGGREGKTEGGLGAVTVSTVTKTTYSSGGSREGKKGPSSSAIGYSPLPKERKSITTMAAALSEVFDESSSTDSSLEYRRKEYGTSNATSSTATRGRTQSRESEIRARLQSASPPARWTELDDVKRLLRGNCSTSTSPTQSPNNTLPIPKKASVETKVTSEGSTDQYGSAWSGDMSNGYGYNRNPNNFTATSHLYQSGAGVQNNLTLSSPSVNAGQSVSSSVPVYGVQNNLTGPTILSPTGASSQIVYGLQKNLSGISAPTVRPSSPTSYEASGKDLNFVLIEKENAPVKKETERLVMAKDTGKQFVSNSPAAYTGTFSEDSLKREKQKLSSSTLEEGADAKSSTLKSITKDKSTYAEICKDESGFGFCSCCSWWKWLLGLVLSLLLLLGLLFGLIALGKRRNSLYKDKLILRWDGSDHQGLCH